MLGMQDDLLLKKGLEDNSTCTCFGIGLRVIRLRVSPELPMISGLCRESPAKEVCKSTIIVLRGKDTHTPSAMSEFAKVGLIFLLQIM